MQTPSSRKGKAKALDQDFEDLDPTITYRHLHSRNLGVRDPLRVIALCDSDAFYAACEMVRLGVDKDTPLVVLQWDALIAINYPARKFGITRLKKYNMKELQAKHPDLRIVHVATYKEGETQPGYWDNVDTKTHKVSLDYYRRESLKIAAKFKDCLPNVEIEKASIDEAFFDFSQRAREIILERYPHLAHVPPDAPNGADTPLPPPPTFSWKDIEHSIIIPTDPIAQEDSAAEGPSTVLDVPDSEPAITWHDIALSIGAELMSSARRQVHEELGYSTSASILKNAAIPNYLRPLPFQKIRFLGGKLGTALASEFEAATVGDLFGIDRTEVKEKKSTLNKSMLASKNLPRPITNASEGFHWIRVLAAELALRLKEAREISPNLWPKSLVIRARRGYDAGHSKQAPFPFTSEVTVDSVAAAGNALWKDLVGTDLAMKVTSISLSFSGIEGGELGQQSIEGFFKPGPPAKRRHEDNDDHVDQLEQVADGDPQSPHDSFNDSPESCGTFFQCKRCGKRIALPSSKLSPVEHRERLEALRVEHEDFHFAQDLAQMPDNGSIVREPLAGESKHVLKPTSRSSPKKKKKRKEEPRGIEQFFRRA
ncbi:hypothetical protein H0H93_009858 [Arthromyces matolae]|nr:hypothetical protein H0H93_009858 [Arthromyces matolae]